MAQHDYDIANQLAPNFRADLNNVLAAIVSQNSGASAPSTTFANMFWYDTTNNILKMRDETDSVWLNLLYIDQSNGAEFLQGDVVNTGGTTVGRLDVHPEATWETGTNTSERLISPEKLKAAIEALSVRGMDFLASKDASSVASLDFTEFDNSVYDSYLFTFHNVIPATDDVHFICRTSANGGSSYDSGGSDYKWTALSNSVGGASGSGDQSADRINLTVIDKVGSDAGEDGLSGELRMYGAHLTKKTKITSHCVHQNSAGNNSQVTAGGERSSSAIVDACRFLFVSGNIESGTITMYGLRNG